MVEDVECPTCCHIGNRLTDIQHECETTSLIRAIKEWSQDTPTWDILYWSSQLLQPSVSRGRRMSGPRQGLFIVFEGIDGSGKTFHLDAVKEALISRSRAIHSVVFPNNRMSSVSSKGYPEGGGEGQTTLKKETVTKKGPRPDDVVTMRAMHDIVAQASCA